MCFYMYLERLSLRELSICLLKVAYVLACLGHLLIVQVTMFFTML
jgi:hypothetical protein